MGPMWYVLDEQHRTVPADEETAIPWFGKPERQVAADQIGDVYVSTIFLVMDHRIPFDDEPLLFETMILGGAHDQEMWRCSTWEQAKEQHKEAVALVRRGTLRVVPK